MLLIYQDGFRFVLVPFGNIIIIIIIIIYYMPI